ncbi:MAG: hypothetical protein ACRD5E_08290 [Nitrososphaeraceae archaeon]
MVAKSSKDNPRVNLTANKYRKQINWRRMKIRELCIRGYSQFEISSTLQISQPSVSRDLQFIRYLAVTRNKKEFGKRLFFEQLNTLDGLGELMKNLWRTIDDPRVQVKERTKAMKLILECYKIRFQLIDSEPFVKDFYQHGEQIKTMEQDISRRERALKAYLEGRKLTQEEIDFSTDPNAVF